MDFEARLNEFAEAGAEGVRELVDAIIREGIRRRASDIHLEPAGDSLLLRFRLDGVLHPAVAIPTGIPLNAIARVKVLADLLTYQTDTPQEGRIGRDKVGASADLRVASFPTVRGEKVLVRLFDSETELMRLDQLGYPDAIRAAFERHLTTPKGMILLTGPAGSGKTTTIYAALRFILDESGGARHVVTVEDPVEQVLDGVTQTEVRPGVGLTFACCLRSMLRHDPEVIVVGEIRDQETAGIAVEAGLTGHLVISTIHSGTAAGVFTRLLEMGIEPYLVASPVSFVVAQRLIRRLCPACARLVEDEAGLLGLPGDLLGRAREAAGCESCFGTGYRGRTVIAEALSMAGAVRERVLARAATDAIHAAAVEEGMRTLGDAAAAAVREGITSPEELRRVLGPDAAGGA